MKTLEIHSINTKPIWISVQYFFMDILIKWKNVILLVNIFFKEMYSKYFLLSKLSFFS